MYTRKVKRKEKLFLGKLNKAFNCLVNLIFYPVFIMVLVVAILFACGIKPYITMSGSMEPAIHTGSICFVNTKADYAEIEEGDVIAYRTAVGGLVTHRVIGVTEDGLETMGDNNEVSDGVSTTAENFHGKTLFSVPYVGYALRTLQNPRNFAILAVVVVLLVIYGLLSDYFDRQEAKKKKEESKPIVEIENVESNETYKASEEAETNSV